MMKSLSIFVRQGRVRSLLSLLLLGASFWGLLSVWEPYWQTNDDVGMAMRAEGFGSIAASSRNLIFSNVLWGALVRCVPDIHGVMGYSLAIYLVLLVTALLACHFMIRRGLGVVVAPIVVFGVFCQTFVFPQFTIVSGLAAMVAVLALLDYRERQEKLSLFLCFALAAMSYLIRWNEFLFVGVVSLPLWFSVEVFRDRAIMALFLAVAAVILVAVASDRASYSDSGWDKYKAFNAMRVDLTDYGLADHLKATPNRSPSDLSDNDLDLLRHWFFVDDSLTSVPALEKLRLAAPVKPVSRGLLEGMESIRLAWKNPLAFLFMLAVAIICLLLGSGRAWLYFFAFFVATFFTGYMGRPGVFRVYYPALAACLLWMTYQATGLEGKRRWLAYAVPVLLAAVALWLTIGQHMSIERRASEVRRDARGLGTDVMVTWGASFPYEYIYSPLDRDLHVAGFRFYSLASGTYAPTSLAYQMEKESPGWFVNRLLSAQGLDFVGYADNIMPEQGDLLRGYCKQHYQGELALGVLKSLGSIVVVNARCVINHGE